MTMKGVKGAWRIALVQCKYLANEGRVYTLPMNVTRPQIFVAFDVEPLAAPLVSDEGCARTIETVLAECDVVRADGSLD